MKMMNWRRILSLVLISMMMLTAMPMQTLAEEQVHANAAAQPAQTTPSGDPLAEPTATPLPEITEEQKAWVLAQYGLTGEEDFLNDAFFGQYYDAYQVYLEGQDASAGSAAQDPVSEVKEPGVVPAAPTPDPLNAGIGGATEGDFFIDEDDDLVIDGEEDETLTDEMDEEDEIAGIDETEETLGEDAEATEDETEEILGEAVEATEDDAEAILDENADELGEALADDESEVLGAEDGELLDDELLDEEETLEEEVLEEELLEEEEVVEEAPAFSMVVEPEGASFMATGEEIKPVFHVLDAEGNVVSSYPEETGDWAWGGDLSATEAGEYRATASFGDASASASWVIEQHMFTGMLARSMLLTSAPKMMTSYTGEVQRDLGKISAVLNANLQNFGTQLRSLGPVIFQALGNSEWIPDESKNETFPLVGFTFSNWYQANTGFIWPKAPGKLDWDKGGEFLYQVRVDKGNGFDFNGFMGQYESATTHLLPIQVNFKPQPYTVNFTANVELLYGEPVPALGRFHSSINDDVNQTENMHPDVMSGLDEADLPSRAFSFSWNGDWHEGKKDEFMGVGSHGPIVGMTNSNTNYYAAVLDAKTNRTPTVSPGGSVKVLPLPVDNDWKLNGDSGPFTGNNYEAVIDLTATPAAASRIGLKGAEKLPFSHGNEDLLPTITVTKTNANGTTTENLTATSGVDKVLMKEVGSYTIKVKLGNKNYVFANGTDTLMKTFTITPIEVTPKLTPNSHLFSTTITYYLEDLKRIDNDNKNPDVVITGSSLLKSSDYDVTKIEGAGSELHNVGNYNVTVTLTNPNFTFVGGSKTVKLPYTVATRGPLTVEWPMGTTFVYGSNLPHPETNKPGIAIVRDNKGNPIPVTDYFFKYYGPDGVTEIPFAQVKDVKNYTVEVKLVDTVNDSFASGSKVRHNFTITPKAIPAPWKHDTFEFGKTSKTYNASTIAESAVLTGQKNNTNKAFLDGFVGNDANTGYTVAVTNLPVDRIIKAVNKHSVTVTITNANYCFIPNTDKTLAVVATGATPMTATFTIEVTKHKIVVDDKTDKEYEYGDEPDDLIDVRDPDGPGDVIVDVTHNGDPIDPKDIGEPGDYTIDVKPKDPNNNDVEKDPEDDFKFTIKPRSIPSPWVNDSFIYGSPSPVYKLSSIPKTMVVDKVKDFGLIRKDGAPYILAADWPNWNVGSSYTFTVVKDGVQLAETDTIENKGIYNVTVTINSKYYRFNKTLDDKNNKIGSIVNDKTATFKIVVLPRIADAERIIEERYDVGTIPTVFETPEDLVNVTDVVGNPFPGDYKVTLYDKDNNEISVEDANKTPGTYCVTVELLNPNDEFTDGSSQVSFLFTVVDPNAGDGGNGGDDDDKNGGGDDHGDHLLDPLGEDPNYPLSQLPEGPIDELQAIIDEMNGEDILWLTYHEEEKAGWTVFENLNIIGYLGDDGEKYTVLKAIRLSDYYGSERNYTTDLLTVIPAENGRVLMAAVWDTDLNRTTQNMLLIDPLAMELVTMNNTVNCSWLDLSLSGMYTSFFCNDELVTIDIPNAFIVHNSEDISTVAYMLDEHLLEYVSNAQATLLDTAKFARYTNGFSWGSYPLAQATNEGVLVRVTDGAMQGDHLLTASTADQSVLQERYLLTSKVEKQEFYRWLEKQPRQSSTMYAANYLD